MRMCEVDLNLRLLREETVLAHLLALVVGERAAQLGGQRTQFAREEAVRGASAGRAGRRPPCASGGGRPASAASEGGAPSAAPVGGPGPPDRSRARRDGGRVRATGCSGLGSALGRWP